MFWALPLCPLRRMLHAMLPLPCTLIVGWLLRPAGLQILPTSCAHPIPHCVRTPYSPLCAHSLFLIVHIPYALLCAHALILALCLWDPQSGQRGGVVAEWKESLNSWASKEYAREPELDLEQVAALRVCRECGAQGVRLCSMRCCGCVGSVGCRV